MAKNEEVFKHAAYTYAELITEYESNITHVYGILALLDVPKVDLSAEVEQFIA